MGGPGFREGLYRVYSPKIWAELMRLKAPGFLKMEVRRDERGYICVFRPTRDGGR